MYEYENSCVVRDEVVQKAFGRWFRDCAREGWVPEQPSLYSSDAQWDAETKSWVVELRNCRGVLETYRARADALGRVRFESIDVDDACYGE